jgi:hypothetical protein
VKPDVPVVLGKVGQALLAQIGPEIRAEYTRSTALVATLLLQCVAEEWERGAARRVEENAALRALFREARAAVADASLRERLREASEGRDDDLRLSTLDRSNDALRGLLVELHAHVEEQEGETARVAETAIWRELRRSTERRALSVSPF